VANSHVSVMVDFTELVRGLIRRIMRRFIRNSSLLYPVYVRYVLRNSDANFPCASTGLHLTGFPRSANTYCMNIVNEAFPALSVSTHIHTTASLKLALKYSVPTIVLVRDPVSTCCSMLLKRHVIPSARKVESLLRDYIEYHTFVLKHCDEFRILSFRDVVSSPEYIVRSVGEFLAIEINDDQVSSKAEAGQALVESKEASKAEEGSSLPNAKRKEMRKLVEPAVVDHSSCASASELFRALVPDE